MPFVASLLHRDENQGNQWSNKMLLRRKITPPPNECCIIPFSNMNPSPNCGTWFQSLYVGLSYLGFRKLLSFLDLNQNKLVVSHELKGRCKEHCTILDKLACTEVASSAYANPWISKSQVVYLPTVLSKVDNFFAILWAPLGLSYTEVQEGFKC